MKSVLIICRDKELRSLIKEAISGLPVNIAKECDSVEGVPEAMVEKAADLVILDLFLPGASGLEVVKVLKKLKEDAEFVLITRLRTRSAIDRAFRMGAQDVLVYPFAAATLTQTLAHRLGLPVRPGTAP